MSRLQAPGFVVWAAVAISAACHGGLRFTAGSDGGSRLDAAEVVPDVVTASDSALASDAPDDGTAGVPVLADSSLVLVAAPMEVAQVLRVGTNYGRLMVVVYSDASAVRPMVGNQWDDGASDAWTVTVIPPGSPEVVKFMQDLALDRKSTRLNSSHLVIS